MKTDTDGKPGLRIESAASVLARDMIAKHIGTFSHVIMNDVAANRSTMAAYIDGLAGIVALTVAGGHGSVNEVTQSVMRSLEQSIARDLSHLRKQ